MLRPRRALREAKAKGRHDVLMRMKTAGASVRFFAMPVGKQA